MKALIIVDLQNDFVMGGSLAVPAGKKSYPWSIDSKTISISSWRLRTGTRGTTAVMPPIIRVATLEMLSSSPAGGRILTAEKAFVARTRAEAHKRPARQCEPAYEIA